jgi:hypothetical protein
MQQSTTNPSEQQIIDYLYDEEAKRERSGLAAEAQILQFRGVLQQEMEPGRLAWASEKTHKATLAATTQLATHTVVDSTRRIQKKVTGITHRRPIIVATDTIIVADLASKDDEEGGNKLPTKRYLQLYVEMGKDTNSEASGRLTGFAMSNKSEFPETLLDFIRNRYIPKCLWMDGAKEEDSLAVRRVYRRFIIADPIKSEPEHQYQNPAEVLGVGPFKRVWRTVEQKGAILYNFVLPLTLWLYKAMYIIDILNHRASNSGTGTTQGRTPIEKSGDPTPDVSQFRHSFGEPVVYHDKSKFPLAQIRFGNSLGPSPTGNYLCQNVLTKEGTVISRSAVESVANIKKKGMSVSVSPSVELKGGNGSNPTKKQTVDLTDNGELAGMMDDYEPASEAIYNERQAEHEEFDVAMKTLSPDSDPEEIYGEPCELPDNDPGDGAISTSQEQPKEIELDIEDDDDEERYANPWLASKGPKMYYPHKIVGMSDPRGDQVRVFPGLPEEEYCQKTQRNRLSLLVNWGEGEEGNDTYEPFARIKQSAPQMVAEYVRGELGSDLTKHQSGCLRNAVKWTNNYLAAGDENSRALIQELDASGYFETNKESQAIEEHLKAIGIEENSKEFTQALDASGAKVNKSKAVTKDLLRAIGIQQVTTLNVPDIRGDHQGEGDPTRMFKIGVEENAKVQYGKRVPVGPKQAQEFEKIDGNPWYSGAAKEECVTKLCDKYETFGIGEKGDKCPDGYQEIKLKIVYTNSPEGVIKARCCAVGCGVDSGNLNRYFCVVDHSHARAVMTVALANGLQIRVVDVKSAYVTCRAEENVWVRALPAEFGEHAGKAAIVEGNLYGLNTAGAVWATSCRAQLQKMGFIKSLMMEQYITGRFRRWMAQNMNISAPSWTT